MKHMNTVLIIVALLSINAAHATLWYVHPDSVMNCVQHCLDSCSTGDTVLVGPGTYYENINWPSMQDIDLVSENGSASTIIDGGGIGRVIRIGIAVSQSTLIEGFTVQNGYDPSAGGGIDCAYGASPIIRGNFVINNVADSVGAGILCAYNSSPLIDSNTIMNNTSHYFAAGIGCWSNSHPTIQRNIVINNVADFNTGGIGCVSSSPQIIGNTITGNIGGEFFGGIGADDASAPTVRDNTITDNVAMWGAGIGLYGYGVIVGNNISGNVADSAGGGIYCDSISTARVDSNVITSNTAQIGGGIYCGPGTSPTIFGNIISQNTGNGFSTGGGGISTGAASPTITYNIIDNNSSSASGGGGILCAYTSNPIIANNTITNNTCAAGGGGILIYVDCAPTISDNIVTYNTAGTGYGGGGLCFQTTISSVTGNTVTNNTAAHGGGICCTQYDSSTFSGNTITNNTGYSDAGGIACRGSSAPVISYCLIADNNGDGIHCRDFSSPSINYNDIIDNVGYGVRNISSITINAENNWWGDATGPYHPTTHPGGLGDTVSDYVDYDPWWTSPGIEEYITSSPLTLNLQVSPNPFTHFTDIGYQITDNGYKTTDTRTEIRIYDVSGRLVKDFILSSVIGYRSSVKWDGTDQANRQLASGVYFVELRVGGYTETQKILLVR